MENQKYPIGLQSFSEVRGGNYVYIDKTEGVYNIVKEKNMSFCLVLVDLVNPCF